jgi:hypothetical protein
VNWDDIPTPICDAEEKSRFPCFDSIAQNFERDRAELIAALDGLMDACYTLNEANGKQMIDPHSMLTARALLARLKEGK